VEIGRAALGGNFQEIVDVHGVTSWGKKSFYTTQRLATALRTCGMIPLLLAAALTLAPEHRVADLRTGATWADETALAIDGNRLITYLRTEGTLRAVPIDDPAAATTLATNVSSNFTAPLAAPPLIAWLDTDRRTHIAPIDAPGRETVLSSPRPDVYSMQCNAKACLAATDTQLLLLDVDAKLLDVLPISGAVLAADPDGFLVRRNDAALTRIDDSGALTFTTPAPSLPPQTVADFDGSRYVLVWADTDFASQTSALQALAVGLAGNVGTPVALAQLPAFPSGIAVAHGAGRHLVAFTYADSFIGLGDIPGFVDRTRLHALRFDDALRALDAAPFVVDGTPWADLRPLAAPRGNGFLIAWSHGPGMIFSADPEAAEIDADGRVGPRILASRGLDPQSVSSIAAVPGALLVAYIEYPHETGATPLRLRRFRPDGAPLGDPFTAGDAWRSAMAPRGSDVLLVWEATDYHVKAAIVHPGDALQPVPLPPLSGIPSVAAGGDGWMIATSDFSGSVETVRVDANGAASAPQTIASLENATFDAAVASDGDRFLVVWATEFGNGSPLCNFQPCGTRAALLDATGGILAADLKVSSQHELNGAAFAGGEYFVAGTTAVRLDRDGHRIGEGNVHATRVTPLGNAVLAVLGAPGVGRLIVIDHGVLGVETVLGVSPIEISSGGVAYNVNVGDVTAVVFRAIVSDRRRTAYH
jgi:hypothetical protein